MNTVAWFVAERFDERVAAYLEDDEAARGLHYPCIFYVMNGSADGSGTGVLVIQFPEIVAMFKEIDKIVVNNDSPAS